MTDRQTARDTITAALSDGRTSLTADEAKEVCDAYGIPTPAQGIAKSPDEACEIAARIGYPVVAKVESRDVLHKTDVGGVIIGLASDTALREAHQEIVRRTRARNPDANIDGVLVQRQFEADAATEVIVGAVTDPVFGKLVAFGLGGVLVEVLKDLTFRLAPTTEEEAAGMLDELAGAAVLDGVRGAACRRTGRPWLHSSPNVGSPGHRRARDPRTGPEPRASPPPTASARWMRASCSRDPRRTAPRRPGLQRTRSWPPCAASCSRTRWPSSAPPPARGRSATP